jgi:hypothetical protein
VDIRTKLPFLIYDDFTPQRYEIEIDAKLLAAFFPFTPFCPTTSCRPRSASHKVNYLDPVAIRDDGRRPFTATHDVLIALNRNSLGR